MRVTIAVAACLVALVRADSASALDAGARSIAASICEEPSRLVERVLPREQSGLWDARELASREVREATDESGTLWCISPDDPRCSPLDSGSSSSVSFARAKLGSAAGDLIPVPRARELAAPSGDSDYRGSARDGVLGRLERPPRAGG